MAVTLGDAFVLPTSQTMCRCTDHSHEDVRRLIKVSGLKSIPAVMQELGWKTPGGCHSCRPALNYYLLSDWPLDYQDDRQSRFVNERNHANIQKDGTYSVVPRMWGGVTTPAELRAIADAADKYNVPMVKVTGGQRIDLLGVKKADLPLMWAACTPLAWYRGTPIPRVCARLRPAWEQSFAGLVRKTARVLASSLKSFCGGLGRPPR